MVLTHKTASPDRQQELQALVDDAGAIDRTMEAFREAFSPGSQGEHTTYEVVMVLTVEAGSEFVARLKADAFEKIREEFDSDMFRGLDLKWLHTGLTSRTWDGLRSDAPRMAYEVSDRSMDRAANGLASNSLPPEDSHAEDTKPVDR